MELRAGYNSRSAKSHVNLDCGCLNYHLIVRVVRILDQSTDRVPQSVLKSSINLNSQAAIILAHFGLKAYCMRLDLFDSELSKVFGYAP